MESQNQNRRRLSETARRRHRKKDNSQGGGTWLQDVILQGSSPQKKENDSDSDYDDSTSSEDEDPEGFQKQNTEPNDKEKFTPKFEVSERLLH
jgi:hypothetical protein